MQTSPIKPATNGISQVERTWATLVHLSAFSGFIFPLLTLLAPLIIWLLKRHEFAFLNDQGREAVNFQITMFLAGLVCIPLMFIGIGVALVFALVVVNCVFIIMAAVNANKGQYYRYPFALRLIK